MKPSKRLGAFLALNLSLVPTVLAASNCDQLSGSVYTGYNGFKFDILCDTSTINGNIFAYYSNGDEFQDCVDRCDSVPICAVALYLAGSGDCALINTYQGTRSFNGNDVAMKRPPESATTTSAEFTSSEASSTEVQSTSTEDLTTETSSIEATTTVVSSTEVSSAEEVSSTEVSTTEDPSTMISSIETTSSEATSAEGSSTEVLSTEDSATETSTIEATSSEPSSTETSSIEEALPTEPSSIETSSAEATSTTASAATTSTSSEASSESASTSQDYTLVTTTTDSPYTSTASIETSTDDCDDETSSIETSTVGVTSTGTGSEIQPTTLPTDSLSSPATTIQTSELSTLASSEASASTSEASSSTTAETQAETQNSVSTSLPSSVTSEAFSSLPTSSKNTVTETHTTYTQVTSSSDSSSRTTEHGSKTLSASGVTTMKTNSASGLATPYPTSDCVWTVYLTMVEYVTCSTGVVPETAITTTYVTADGHGGNYRPPVVTLPSGCIGGYQVDASGHSYPVAQPTKGSYGNIPDHGYDQPSVRPTPGSSGNSHPGYDNDRPHVPAPTAESHGNSEPEYSNDQPTVPQSTQGSHANYPDNKYSQPSAPGYVSPSQESNKNEPQPTGSEAAKTTIPAYGPGAPVNSPASSAVHHGHVGNATTFAIWTTATEERHAPSASSSTPEEAPYTPVIASRASRHQGMVWTLIAGTLIALIN
ncbi:hypothetical protein FVEN_g5664 [Fusarium venenatum]|uniref:Apple domain-containing protein n=1 Tax=Fusarium venenatum TaxID=56646 RepID=A0A2L2THS6_9HYPO|nr:uncharacterized protein FVRRES_04085 [Fusarium venenatum]KAG8356575.1 hypothetical protein FVEN_g5664 [Fusarium venenatum]CEI67573.1 unnamed protein product [Fusarium venenatum]